MSRETISARAILLCVLALGIAGCAANRDLPKFATVQFERSRSQILVPVRIGEEKETRWFLLDTAVDPSVVDESLLELESVDLLSNESHEAEGTGDGKGLDIRRARINRYAVGTWDMSMLDAVATDLSGFGRSLGRELAGILGYSFLKDKVVRLDYKNSRLDLASGREFLSQHSGVQVQAHDIALRFMSAADSIPIIDLQINGQIIRCTLDTGSSLGIQIYDSAVTRLRLESVRDAAEASSITGARGEAKIRNATLDHVVLGSYVEDHVPVSFSSRQHDPDERQGNVGNRFLGRFLLTLDYIEGRIVFER